jgi:CubicO group peptidase (beta-lactamase class C family)
MNRREMNDQTANIRELNEGRANSRATLVVATGYQERRFSVTFGLLEEAISQKVFPGAALAVTLRGALVAWKEFGRFTYEVDSPRVMREMLWDLASLTKVIATTSMAMLLWERGKLSLETRVAELLPEFAEAADRRREAVTVRMLLAHSGGLPAHRKLYLEAQGREAVTAAAIRVPLEAAPMSRVEYSDIGFIVLGELLERLAGERLDEFCGREIFDPLKLNMRFIQQPSVIMGVSPTAMDIAYRGRVVQGEVNDENASAMGGVAGHAGLFGDAASVARFAECMLRGGSPVFRAETVRLFTTREERPEGSSRALGWDTPSEPSQSGTRFSGRSFGHLGYTGTSLWCDPERELSVTLLTNRTWPDARNQAIKEVRPRVHDAIVEAFEHD